MARPFDSFVIFAEMRTGSNFLETNLNAIEGVTCHGEAFNPHFIGYPNKDALLGVSQDERDADPLAFLKILKSSGGLSGFRYFHDHDPRILSAVIEDRRCAKVILQRNPVDSYVSWKIAQSTGQWKLTDVSRRRGAKVRFDASEFAECLNCLQSFHSALKTRLQESGQTAFELGYDDLGSLDVINGLAAYLGVTGRLDALDQSLKVQNPAPLADKVNNPDALAEILEDVLVPDVHSPPVYEPDRMAAATTYMTAAKAPLLFMPVRGGPNDAVHHWLAKLDGADPQDVMTGMTQKGLRKWKREHPKHRGFTVVRHPLERAHHVYCSYILGEGPIEYTAIRHNLARRSAGVIPADRPQTDYTVDTHYQGFKAFLSFLGENLNGQTPIRVDSAWAHQAQVVAGFARFASPDMILRAEDLATDLPDLAARVGCEGLVPDPVVPDTPFSLDQVYDGTLEDLAQQIYKRDYITFGYQNWR